MCPLRMSQYCEDITISPSRCLSIFFSSNYQHLTYKSHSPASKRDNYADPNPLRPFWVCICILPSQTSKRKLLHKLHVHFTPKVFPISMLPDGSMSEFCEWVCKRRIHILYMQSPLGTDSNRFKCIKLQIRYDCTCIPLPRPTLFYCKCSPVHSQRKVKVLS